MKKCITLFAMLLIVSVAMADREPITNPKDTVNITISDCSRFTDETDTEVGMFYLESYDNDSDYFVSLCVKAAAFAAGNYPDTVASKSFIKICTEGNRKVYFNNGLGDLVVTIDSTTNPYRVFNFKFPFVGRDSVLYNLDITFNEPYEVTSEELTTDSISILEFETMAFAYCWAGAYKMSIMVLCDSITGLEGTHKICDNEALELADTITEKVYYAYSGTITFTKNGEEYDISARILTYDNHVFYFNKPTEPSAVEDVTEESARHTDVKVTKYMIDGQLFIERDGVTYDAQGRVVRRMAR